MFPQPARSAPVLSRANCYRCFKAQVACICDSIESVANRTGIIILQHPRERFHAIGTARIARLALQRVRIESCAPWLDSSKIRDTLPPQTALLYPAPGARDLTTLPPNETPRHLAILDGTWFHAKKMYDAHHWLRALPSVSLMPNEPSRYRLRREPKESFVATVEAIAHALRLLEPDTAGIDGLLRSFDRMIDRQATWAPLPQ